jgi:hypothetical protein
MSPWGTVYERYVRIPKSLLSSVKLYHLESGIDLSLATPSAVGPSNEQWTAPAGYTEWYADYRGEPALVTWDWAIVGDFIVVLAPTKIRTNIKIIDERGQDESPIVSRLYILDWLDTLPWRDKIRHLWNL